MNEGNCRLFAIHEICVPHSHDKRWTGSSSGRIPLPPTNFCSLGVLTIGDGSGSVSLRESSTDTVSEDTVEGMEGRVAAGVEGGTVVS